MLKRSLFGYSGSQITLHWVIALIVFFQLIFGDSMTEAIKAVERGAQLSSSDQLWADLHYYSGVAILVLVAVRLIVRSVSGAPPVQQRGWMNVAATFSHMLFYAVLILAPLLGLLAYYKGDPFADLHTLCKPVLIVLIGVHFLAALYHQFWLKDGTLRRMMVPNRIDERA